MKAAASIIRSPVMPETTLCRTGRFPMNNMMIPENSGINIGNTANMLVVTWNSFHFFYIICPYLLVHPEGTYKAVGGQCKCDDDRSQDHRPRRRGGTGRTFRLGYGYRAALRLRDRQSPPRDAVGQ